MRPTDPRHGPIAQLLITWAPLTPILLAYSLTKWISAPLAGDQGAETNRLGFELHVAGPAELDQGLFTVVPSVWLQERLVDGTVHWYDAIAALVYITHFVVIPVVTTLTWFRLRDRFPTWVTTVLAFVALGVAGYVGYPAAPPWMASASGVIGPVDRLSTVGWDYLHLDLLGDLAALGQAGSNPVAAMPSLHAGSALLAALFLWPVATTPGRAVLGTYVMLMALTLVYTGEHYVVDVLAGWAAAGVAVAVGSAVRRRPACHLDPEVPAAAAEADRHA